MRRKKRREGGGEERGGERVREERFWMFSRKGLGENSRTNVPTWNTHQILDFFLKKKPKLNTVELTVC